MIKSKASSHVTDQLHSSAVGRERERDERETRKEKNSGEGSMSTIDIGERRKQVIHLKYNQLMMNKHVNSTVQVAVVI